MYAEKVPVRNDWTILEISENTEEGQVILAFSNTFYFAFQLIYSSFLVIRFNQITLFPRSAARVLITTPEERKSRLENARHTESCENQQLSLQRRCEQRRARLERGTSVHTYGLLASEDANVSVKSLIMQRSSVNFRNTQVKLLSMHLIWGHFLRCWKSLNVWQKAKHGIG